MKAIFSVILGLGFLSFAPSTFAKTVRYELNVTQQPMNLSGKRTVDFALTVNGGIPAPTLEFTEGDDAEIKVTNNIPTGEEVSIHWHGLLLPPEEDGVAYVNTPPIHKGQSHTFRFKLRQHGTYWYHSHTALQEQKGVYGAFIIHPKKKTIQYDKDVVVVLSDWTDEDGDQVLKNLRKDGDYYLYKKDSMRSYAGALKAGGLKSMLKNEWNRMGGMDLSDVGYDAFLINGKRDSQLTTAHPGERIRVRIINAGASSYFYISMGQAPMQVISADGIDIEPRMAKEILMGMAETYDILVTLPEHKNYELRATVQDVTGYASGWIGMAEAEKVKANDKPQPDMYAEMDHGAHGGSTGDHAGHGNSGAHDHNMHKAGDSKTGHAGHTQATGQKGEVAVDPHAGHGSHQGHVPPTAPSKAVTSHEAHQGAHGSHAGHQAAGQAPSGPVIETLTVDELKAQSPTVLPAGKKVHDVKLVLGGDMERYVWHINGKSINEDRDLIINEGDIVRFTFVNDTMMHHPMHLHGHFFRVVNKNGDSSPLKHTVDVGPHMTRTIEFYANEPGEWMLHCHNLYHMKTGMARVVKYSTFTPKPEIAKHQNHDPHLHDHTYFAGNAEVATNHAELGLRASQTWNDYELRVESSDPSNKQLSFDEKWETEADLFYRRWFGQYLNVVAGGTSFAGKEHAVIGVGYKLPMLIESNLLVNHEGEVRLDLEKRFQWTKNLLTDVDFSWRPNQSENNKEAHESEIEVSLMYKPAWSWAAGLMLTNDSLGAGIEAQF